MIMIIAGLTAAILAADGGRASPSTTPPVGQAAATTSAVAARESQVICRRVLETGTRLGGSKLCRTRLEWDLMSRNSQNVVDASQKRSFVYGPKGN